MLTLRDDKAKQEVNEPAAAPTGTPTPTPPEKPELGEAQDSQDEQPRILEEVVIEEVSIDGMCGVY